MNIRLKLTLALLLGVIIGAITTAGIARTSGVPYCAMVDMCKKNIIEENRNLIKKAHENQKRINVLNNEKTVLASEVTSLLSKDRENTNNINAVINDIKTLNISGEDDDVALQKISNALIKVASDLHNITD